MKHDRGYSLFEVLVAFAILVAVLAALLPGKIAILARQTDAQTALLAQDYALGRLARIEAGADPAVEITDTFRDWHIRATALPVDDPPGLVRIDITMRTAAGRDLAQATGLVAEPAE